MTYAATVAPFVDRCLFGDAREMLATVPDGVVQCCVTSPPFYGLRDYGCDGQLGLEATPGEYVTRMVAVFREVRRVLRPDGVCWLEIGDSYANDGKWGGSSGGKHADDLHGETGIGRGKRSTGLKPKDLIGIPWMLAFALRADGWWLRADVVWHRPNPMPESVTDRPTKAHSYVFLLTKSARYYYDADAVKEAAIHAGETVRLGPKSLSKAQATGAGVKASGNAPVDEVTVAAGRNARSVWTIATQPWAAPKHLGVDHFAVMPPALAKRCIAAGTSERGCCPVCGAPWARVVEKTIDREIPAAPPGDGDKARGGRRYRAPGQALNAKRTVTTAGWRPTCDHDETPVPCLVLDPFMGSGTTAMVAQDLGRRWLGTELNRDYEPLQRERTQQLGLLAHTP